MNTDIRIKTSFRGHRKRKKLRVLLGPGSTDYLLDLWLCVSEDRPDGVLTDLDELDIALMAGWEEDPLTFVTALTRCGFLDQNEAGVFVLHDWVEHNPYASSADDRSDSARLVRMASTHPTIYSELKKQGCSGVTRDQYKLLTAVKRPVNETFKVALSPSPSPSPSPSQKHAAREAEKDGQQVDRTEQAIRRTCQERIDFIKEHYPEVNLEVEVEEMVAKYRGSSLGADPFLIISRWLKNVKAKAPPPGERVDDAYLDELAAKYSGGAA